MKLFMRMFCFVMVAIATLEISADLMVDLDLIRRPDPDQQPQRLALCNGQALSAGEACCNGKIYLYTSRDGSCCKDGTIGQCCGSTALTAGQECCDAATGKTAPTGQCSTITTEPTSCPEGQHLEHALFCGTDIAWESEVKGKKCCRVKNENGGWSSVWKPEDTDCPAGYRIYPYVPPRCVDDVPCTCEGEDCETKCCGSKELPEGEECCDAATGKTAPTGQCSATTEIDPNDPSVNNPGDEPPQSDCPDGQQMAPGSACNGDVKWPGETEGLKCCAEGWVSEETECEASTPGESEEEKCVEKRAMCGCEGEDCSCCGSVAMTENEACCCPGTGETVQKPDCRQCETCAQIDYWDCGPGGECCSYRGGVK